MALHRIYFSPGMFGFGRLGSYDYFSHLERAFEQNLRAHGHEVQTFVVDVHPTASIRRRAGRLAELVGQTAGTDGGPIHLVGHSTGALDARIVASPSAHLPGIVGSPEWLGRLRSVSSINGPHYGTPLATFFATVSGQRMLYALSAMTYIALSVGAPPLAAASALAVAVGRIDNVLGLEARVFDRTTEAFLKVLAPAQSREVRDFLEAIKNDQGGVIQLTPEAMDLFQAGVEDRPGTLYQCSVSMAPSPSARRLIKSVIRPWTALSSTVFTTLYGISSRYDDRYPCAAPQLDPAHEKLLARAFGEIPGFRENDGVVPVRSQLWGRLVWAGLADHLDVLGHFEPHEAPAGVEKAGHKDWLSSGASYGRAGFEAMTSALAAGLLESSG